MSALSSQKTSHALRNFTSIGVLWAVYGPNATAAGAIFAGFALSIGVTEPQVAFLVSLTALVGAWQLLSFYLTRRIKNKRLFAIGLGVLEITSASAVVLMALVAPQYRFFGMALLLVAAYLLGNTGNPTFNNWMSNVIPPEVRTRYLGSRMFAVTVASVLWLFVASRWLDLMNKSYLAFAVVFAVGWIAGLMGYGVLGRTDYPPLAQAEPEGFARSLLSPLRNRPFALLMLYQITRTTSYMIAGAFYGVYMIRYLALSYSQIALYTNITLAMMLVSYLTTGSLAQRYGCKPIAQLLIIPAAAVPALWALASPTTYHWVLPLACFANGLTMAGLDVAVSSLLYKTLPGGEENSAYFANWNACVAAGAALGPFLGGLLRTYLPTSVTLAGHAFSTLQVIFGLSAICSLIPIVLTRFLREGEATSPLHLLVQFRGNLLSLAYNYALYSVAHKDGTRGEAMLGLGRSHSPLAVQRLVRGLNHISHDVRSGAAKGLGEGRFPEAVEPLVRELQDRESDIRSEAAEALGKIGAAHDPPGRDSQDEGLGVGPGATEALEAAGAAHVPLVEALHDDDLRVRASAAMALGGLQTAESQDALLEALQQDFDHGFFPTVVDAASYGNDLRIIAPALDGLTKLEAPVVRLQVINAICRVLGEQDHFYRLATADELAEAGLREAMVHQVRRLLRRSRFGDEEQRIALAGFELRLEVALAEDQLLAFAEVARDVLQVVEAMREVPPVAHHAALAMQRYLEERSPEAPVEEMTVFLIIGLTALGRALSEPRP